MALVAVPTPDTLVELPDGSIIRSLIASQINAQTGGVIRTADFARAIQEVTLETQLLGASLLKIPLLDPQWTILDTGMFTPGSDGILPVVDLEFPAGSGWHWRHCQFSWDIDPTQPQQLTFQNRIVSYFRDHWGPKTWPSGSVGSTRAQFIKMLVDEVGRGQYAQAPYFEKPIRFVCPSLNVVQPVATSTTQTNQVTLPTSGASAVANKLPGITNPQLLTAGQQTFVSVLATQTGLDPAVLAAWCYAEENGSPAQVRESQSNFNWLNIGYFDSGPGQIAYASAFSNPATAADQTSLFLKGAWGGASASIRAIIKTAGKSPQIQLNAIWTSDWASSHYNSGTNLVGAYEAITGKKPGTVPTGLSAAVPADDVSQLARGTSQNEDEDSWDCIQRLAQEVGWYAFTYGNTLFYMDGNDLIAQQPTLYLQRVRDRARIPTMTGVVDNTMFEYLSTHKRKGRIQHRARIAKPQTAAEINMSYVCDITDLRAGDAIVFQKFGPANGRWIITDATRNCLSDTFTQLTIEPPIAPFPEPQATAGTSTTSPASGDPSNTGATAASSGGKTYANPADAAQAALALYTKNPAYYVSREARPMPPSLFGTPPVITDCSGFATLCYKAAGLQDPNGLNYNGQGYTGTLIANCVQVGAGTPSGSAPIPGDLCFFGSLPVPVHVVVYVGNGQAIQMNPGPLLTSATSGPGPFLGFWRPKFLAQPFPSITSPNSGFGSVGG